MSKRRRIDPKLQPPWRERMADGSLSEPYGPRTPRAYHRALQAHENWAWQWEHTDPARDAEAVEAYMRPDGKTLRTDVPPTLMETFKLIYERRMTIGEVARYLERSRSSIKSYLRRLRERVNDGA